MGGGPCVSISASDLNHKENSQAANLVKIIMLSDVCPTQWVQSCVIRCVSHTKLCRLWEDVYVLFGVHLVLLIVSFLHTSFSLLKVAYAEYFRLSSLHEVVIVIVHLLNLSYFCSHKSFSSVLEFSICWNICALGWGVGFLFVCLFHIFHQYTQLLFTLHVYW